MAANPLRILKNKVTAAIEWRAREAVRIDEEALGQLSSALAEQSIEFTKRLSVLTDKVEALESRVADLESRDK